MKRFLYGFAFAFILVAAAILLSYVDPSNSITGSVVGLFLKGDAKVTHYIEAAEKNLQEDDESFVDNIEKATDALDDASPEGKEFAKKKFEEFKEKIENKNFPAKKVENKINKKITDNKNQKKQQQQITQEKSASQILDSAIAKSAFPYPDEKKLDGYKDELNNEISIQGNKKVVLQITTPAKISKQYLITVEKGEITEVEEQASNIDNIVQLDEGELAAAFPQDPLKHAIKISLTTE